MNRLISFLCAGFLLFAIPSTAAADNKGNNMTDATLAKATFAGGCFWCMEPPFDKLDGVVSTISGYSGGHKKDPTYKEVTCKTSV